LVKKIVGSGENLTETDEESLLFDPEELESKEEPKKSKVPTWTPKREKKPDDWDEKHDLVKNRYGIDLIWKTMSSNRKRTPDENEMFYRLNKDANWSHLTISQYTNWANNTIKKGIDEHGSQIEVEQRVKRELDKRELEKRESPPPPQPMEDFEMPPQDIMPQHRGAQALFYQQPSPQIREQSYGLSDEEKKNLPEKAKLFPTFNDDLEKLEKLLAEHECSQEFIRNTHNVIMDIPELLINLESLERYLFDKRTSISPHAVNLLMQRLHAYRNEGLMKKGVNQYGQPLQPTYNQYGQPIQQPMQYGQQNMTYNPTGQSVPMYQSYNPYTPPQQPMKSRDEIEREIEDRYERKREMERKDKIITDLTEQVKQLMDEVKELKTNPPQPQYDTPMEEIQDPVFDDDGNVIHVRIIKRPYQPPDPNDKYMKLLEKQISEQKEAITTFITKEPVVQPTNSQEVKELYKEMQRIQADLKDGELKRSQERYQDQLAQMQNQLVENDKKYKQMLDMKGEGQLDPKTQAVLAEMKENGDTQRLLLTNANQSFTLVMNKLSEIMDPAGAAMIAQAKASQQHQDQQMTRDEEAFLRSQGSI